MFEFNDQVVIVTGSGSPKGIGRTIARTFAKQGATVVIADMNEEGIKDTVAVIEGEGGKTTTMLPLDSFVTQEASDISGTDNAPEDGTQDE